MVFFVEIWGNCKEQEQEHENAKEKPTYSSHSPSFLPSLPLFSISPLQVFVHNAEGFAAPLWQGRCEAQRGALQHRGRVGGLLPGRSYFLLVTAPDARLKGRRRRRR
jgi:hypothetical protein